MRRWTFAALCLMAMAAGCSDAHSKECGPLSSCLQALQKQAQAADEDGHDGVGPDADALKQGILAHEGAVDALIPLLKHPDKRVADLAAYVLRDAPEIDAAHLPQIVEGLDRDLGWLAPALARIGTEAAAQEAVERYLVSSSAPHNQEAYALQILGRRAIPFMLDRAACTRPCDDETHDLLGAVLGEMGPERAAAGPGLIRLARDRAASPQVAQGALAMIASLGMEGRALEADLVREREDAPYLAPWIDDALVGIHSSQAGRIFVERLAQRHDRVTLRELADVGAAGRDAGPAVVAILEQEPDLRAAAITTLGYIGYVEATPALVAALDDPADVRVAWAAADALGRLGARDALAALDRTAAGHWYSPVRNAAREASVQVRSVADGAGRRADEDAASKFFAVESINRGLPKCPPRYEARPRSSRTKLYAATASRQLARLKYPADVVSYGAADEDQQEAAGADIIEVNPRNLMEHRQSIEQTPHVALRVDDGWLVGGDRGEWGGEVVFVNDDGRFQRVLDQNVEDIYRLGDRIVATVGLAHMSLNRGAIVELARSSDGQWQASQWRILPGAPATSVASPEGLVISTAGGGAILVRPDGSMQMADCPTWPTRG